MSFFLPKKQIKRGRFLTICLNPEILPNEIRALKETLYQYTPLISNRERDFIFCDIKGSYKTDENSLCHEILKMKNVKGTVIANSTAYCELFLSIRDFDIIASGREQDQSKPLSIDLLIHFQGFQSSIQIIILKKILDFYKSLGFKTFGDLLSISENEWIQQWGICGKRIFQKLYSYEASPIPLYFEKSPDHFLIEFEWPIHSAITLTDHIINLWEGKEFFPISFLKLNFSNDNETKSVHFQFLSPTKNLKLLKEWILPKIEKEISDSYSQIDVFFKQEKKLKNQSNLFPYSYIENNFKREALINLQETLKSKNIPLYKKKRRPNLLPESVFEKTFELIPTKENSIQTNYGKDFLQNLRPNRIRKIPKEISFYTWKSLIYRSFSERIQTSWWDDPVDRSYFLAQTTDQRRLWIYFNHIERNFFLHGLFD